MTVGFLLRKPTQFDVPFFRHVQEYGVPGHCLQVIYLQDPGGHAAEDKELQKAGHWGMDLLSGYPWQAIPAGASADSMQQLYRQWGLEVLITNGYQQDYAGAVQAARDMGLPLALRIDSVLFGKPWWNLLARKYFMRRVYRSFGAFLTTGLKGQEYLQYVGIPQRQWGWFPYCTDNEMFGRERNTDAIEALRAQHASVLSGKRVILSVCKFIPRENPQELLEAFLLLNDPTLALVMVGAGQQEQALQARAAEFPHLTILFPGYVPYPQLPAWYGLADLFVHPAQDEPWGVSVQEALAAGCAVVASSNVGSAFDLIVPGKNGFIYPSGISSKLADSIRAALALPSGTVAEATQSVLATWNYDSVWRSICVSMEALRSRAR